MDTYQIISDVPAFNEFLTVAELSASSRELARRFPKLVTLQTIGTSLEGRPIELLTIGRGRHKALLLGTPHPNEPIGTLTLEYLSRRLCEDDDLREELDYTFLIIKCADPDGTILNEGWFKQAFSPLTYALNYYRPPAREQVEWSFPVHYKTLHFTESAPETRAVMSVMEHAPPHLPLLAAQRRLLRGVLLRLAPAPRPLPALAARRGVAGPAMHRGEPEAPYIKASRKASSRLFGVQERYDYLARNLDEDPASSIECGTSSDDYLKSTHGGVPSCTEVPYYFDPTLRDTSPAGITRREAMLQGVFRVDSIYHDIREYFAIIGRGAPRDRLYRSVDDYVKRTAKRSPP